MKQVRWVGGLAAVLALVSFLGVSLTTTETRAADEESGYTIKEVMVQGHKKGLLKKVLSGDSTDEEKLKLLDLYISLVEADPPEGDNASWQRLAGGSALAAAKVVVGRDGALVELKEATKCAVCHKAHKGE